MVQQEAPDDRPDRVAEEERPGHHGDRLLPFLLAEHDRDDRDRHREDGGSADAERCPRGDQLTHAGRVGAPHRAGDEHDERGEQHLLPPVPVAEQPGREDQGGDHQGVGVGDPLQVSC